MADVAGIVAVFVATSRDGDGVGEGTDADETHPDCEERGPKHQEDDGERGSLMSVVGFGGFDWNGVENPLPDDRVQTSEPGVHGCEGCVDAIEEASGGGGCSRHRGGCRCGLRIRGGSVRFRLCTGGRVCGGRRCGGVLSRCGGQGEAECQQDGDNPDGVGENRGAHGNDLWTGRGSDEAGVSGWWIPRSPGSKPPRILRDFPAKKQTAHGKWHKTRNFWVRRRNHAMRPSRLSSVAVESSDPYRKITR